MTFGQAATFVQSYETMLFAFTRRTTVREGETVLVLGAGGGIGLAAVDLARVARPAADRGGVDAARSSPAPRPRARSRRSRTKTKT